VVVGFREVETGSTLAHIRPGDIDIAGSRALWVVVDLEKRFVFVLIRTVGDEKGREAGPAMYRSELQRLAAFTV
jgi:hypothetical protein